MITIWDLELPQSDSWDEWYTFIDDMLDCEQFEFASDTLNGISANVTKYENITSNQINAVTNIYKSVKS